MKYRSEIDGLRAIAVIPVILFHAGIKIFSGGFVGVDIFFVISGFLITTIILTEMEQGSFSIVNFYERRARRILPALFLVTLVSLPFAWLFLMPVEMKDYSQSLVAVATFSSNILFWQEAGYWDTASELKPLLHTWSLAVEEQYYVLFPLFLIFTWKYRKRFIFGSIFIIAGISLALSNWGAYHSPSATFYLLPTRFWEFAIGSGVAFYLLYKKDNIDKVLTNNQLSELLGVLGILMVGYSIFVFDEQTPFPSFYTLLPTVGTGLIIIFSSSHTIVGRFLRMRPLVLVGLISYSAYLWHQPIFSFSRHIFYSEPGNFYFLCMTVLIFPLSYLTWKYVENPFRNKSAFGQRNIFILAIIVSLVIIAVGTVGIYFDGFNQRSIYTNLLEKSYQPDNNILQTQSWQLLRAVSKNANYGVQNNDFDNKLWFKKNDQRENLLIVGNSHSKDMYNVLQNSNTAQSNFQIARYGTQINSLMSHDSKLFLSPNYEHADIIMLASRYYEKDLPHLEPVVQKLIKDNKKVVIVKNIFEFNLYSSRTLADIMLQKMYLKKYKNGEISIEEITQKIDRAYFKEFSDRDRKVIQKKSDDAIDAIVKEHKGVIVLDRMDYACNTNLNKCYSMNDQFEKYYYDYGHHTLAGATFFGKQIDEINWVELIKK